jgi:hypothetical protein
MVNVTRTIISLSSAGAVLSGSNCLTGGGLAAAYAIALDDSGNAWVTKQRICIWRGRILKLRAVLSGANGYTGGGLGNAAPDRHGWGRQRLSYE